MPNVKMSTSRKRGNCPIQYESSADSEPATPVKKEKVPRETPKTAAENVPVTGADGFELKLVGKAGSKRKGQCNHVMALTDPHTSCPKCRDIDGLPVCNFQVRCPQCLTLADKVIWDSLFMNLRKNRREARKKQEERRLLHESTGVLNDNTYTYYICQETTTGDFQWHTAYLKLPYYGTGMMPEMKTPIHLPIRPLGVETEILLPERICVPCIGTVKISPSLPPSDADDDNQTKTANTDAATPSVSEAPAPTTTPTQAVTVRVKSEPKSDDQPSTSTPTPSMGPVTRQAAKSMVPIATSDESQRTTAVNKPNTDSSTSVQSATEPKCVDSTRVIYPGDAKFIEDIEWLIRALCTQVRPVSVSVAVPEIYQDQKILKTIYPNLHIEWDAPPKVTAKPADEPMSSDEEEEECATDTDSSDSEIIESLVKPSQPRPQASTSAEPYDTQPNTRTTVVQMVMPPVPPMNIIKDKTVQGHMHVFNHLSVSEIDHDCRPQYTVQKTIPALGRVPVYKRDLVVQLPDVIGDLGDPLPPTIRDGDEFPFQRVLKHIKDNDWSDTKIVPLHTVRPLKMCMASSRQTQTSAVDYYGITTCRGVLTYLETLQSISEEMSAKFPRRYCELKSVRTLPINEIPYRSVDGSVPLQPARWPRRLPQWMPTELAKNMDVPVTDITMRHFENNARLAIRALSMQDVLLEAFRTLLFEHAGSNDTYDMYLTAMGRVTDDLTRISTEWLWNIVQLRRDAVVQACTCDPMDARRLRNCAVVFETELFPNLK